MSENDKSEKTVIITARADLSEKTSTLEPYLIQISGRETGQMFNLKGKTLRIGREPDCDVILDDPHVSRHHAEIVCQEKEIIIRDLGSTNGICINGKKVPEQKLQDGDKVLIGTRMYFKFVYQDVIDQNYQQNLFRAANIDALTQVYNKKYFMDVLEKEFSFSRRANQPLSLMMIDIDFFKQINDTYGHVAGDMVLKSLGQHLHKSLRLENVACRYGGEEFAVILRSVGSELAYQIAERLRVRIESDKVIYRNHQISITISLGVSTFTGKNFATVEDLLLKADENLYEAKEGGRNRTILKAA